MKHRPLARRWLGARLFALIAIAAAPLTLTTLSNDGEPMARSAPTAAQLPIRFEPNVGQFDPSVRFVARGGGGTLFLTDTGATMTVNEGPTDAKRRARVDWRVHLRGEEPGKAAATDGEALLVSRHNYFHGNDASRWRTNVPTYGQVRQRSITHGVDVVWHGDKGHLEYDLVVAPGVRPSDVIVEVGGDGEQVALVDNSLEVRLGNRRIRQAMPVVYQDTPTGRVERKASYRLVDDHRIAFNVESYDTTRELVIDPVIYATYLGGAESQPFDGESLTGVAVDATGAVYVTGYTVATDFPLQGAIQNTKGTFVDAVVAKLAADGGSLVYATYLGGDGSDLGHAITVDGTGAAYVTGFTQSTDFPTASAFQGTMGGTRDAFVTKISAAGDALTYSTYLGGNDDEDGKAIAVANDEVVVSGTTASTNFPTATAVQTTNGGGLQDGFVTRFSAAGSTLVFSTYLGGSDEETVNGIAVDGAGAAYVVGSTLSADFPTLGPIQGTYGGARDATLTKLDAAGTRVYGTFLGTAALDSAEAVAVDSTGAAYVVGSTASAGFLRIGGFPAPASGPLQFGFVTKVNAGGNAAPYSLVLGGTTAASTTNITGVAVDGTGSAHISGSSSSFVTKNAVQPNFGGNLDFVVAQIDATGAALVHSTYFGGADEEGSARIALDSDTNEIVVGTTRSNNTPTTSPFQNALKGNADGFIFKLSPVEAGTTTADAATPSDAAPPTDGAAPTNDAATPNDASSVADSGPTDERIGGGGCACRSTARGTTTSGGVALVGLAALLLRRRRRACA